MAVASVGTNLPPATGTTSTSASVSRGGKKMKKKFNQKAQKSSTQDEVEFISCHIITVRSNHKVEHKWKRTNFFQITKAKRHRSCPTRPVQFSLVALKPAVSGRNALSPFNTKSFSGRRKVTGERRKSFLLSPSQQLMRSLFLNTLNFFGGVCEWRYTASQSTKRQQVRPETKPGVPRGQDRGGNKCGVDCSQKKSFA